MPSRCIDSTTGYAAAWPLGLRATSADSSRRKSTRSSARIRTPVAAAASNAGAHSVRRGDEPDALAVVPAPAGLQDAREAEVGDLVGARRRPGSAACGAPMPDSASRMTTLSWAWTSASGPGRTGDPGVLERVQVVGRHVLVVERDDAAALDQAPRAWRGRCSRRPSWSGITWAAETPRASARSRSGMPRAAAGSAIIRASWPPPTTATTGPARLAAASRGSPAEA